MSLSRTGVRLLRALWSGVWWAGSGGGRGQAYRIQFKRQAVEWHFASCFDSRSHNASKIGRLDNIYLGPITGGKRDVDRSVVVRSGTSSFGRPPSTRSASVNPSPEDEASCRLERLSCSTRWRHPSHQLREVAIINSPPATHRILGVFIVNLSWRLHCEPSR